jgi:UDP-2-acetamido-3-amino-2,3-dideoxy-glucuronate N-acetyltransferase
VVNRVVPGFALVVGVPARHVGGLRRHGERLKLPLNGEGSAVCPHTGEHYRLSGDRIQLDGVQ